MSLANSDPPHDAQAEDSLATRRQRQLGGKERLASVVPTSEDVVVPDAGAPPPGSPAWSADEVVEALDRGSDPGELDVRLLRERRPVPPPASSGPPAVRPGPVDELPVYDPFTARRRRPPEWLVRYTATLVACDVLAAVLGVLVAVAVPVTESQPGPEMVAVAVLTWPVVLALLGDYAECRQGAGAEEYRRVVDAGLLCAAILGVSAALVPGHGLGRLLLVATPVAVLVTLVGRAGNRSRLHKARKQGQMTKRVVVVGPDDGVLDVVRRIRRDPAAGLRVVGACVPRPAASTQLRADGVPVLGALESVVRVLDDARADAVVVVSSPGATAGDYLRDLAWRLEGTNIELLVGPGMIEVGASRLQVRPTVTMPLILIREPEFRGVRRLVKEIVDRTAAAVLLVVCAPVFLVIACAIKATSPGPVLYRHRRIGKCGQEFDLLKFRSMTVDADQSVEVLMEFNEGNEVQFKMRRDPRVTRVGTFLRRYSLDELPQLINVLLGTMSLVGPRPHVVREVQHYGPDMHRRLLVKPGITGLWQVSGRSDLCWDEAVELDVRYVENWSLGLDLVILWKTLRVVIRAAGAY